MKTPNDLTEKQKELLGLYSHDATLNQYQSYPLDSAFLSVNARVGVPLHNSGVKLQFHIWQSHSLVGSKEIHVKKENMIHAFDFLFDLASQNRHDENLNMIDCLLAILERQDLS